MQVYPSSQSNAPNSFNQALQELEKLGSKKGVVLQTIKDVLQAGAAQSALLAAISLNGAASAWHAWTSFAIVTRSFVLFLSSTELGG
jgi:hypothetical protein